MRLRSSDQYLYLACSLHSFTELLIVAFEISYYLCPSFSYAVYDTQRTLPPTHHSPLSFGTSLPVLANADYLYFYPNTVNTWMDSIP